MSYQISEEFRDQFPARTTTPPVPTRDGGGAVRVFADAIGGDDNFTAYVSVEQGGRRFSLTPDAAQDLIDQLDEAIDVATGEQRLFTQYKTEQAAAKIGASKPHPRAVQPAGASSSYFWVWCDDGGTFKFTYCGGGGAVTFVPGKDYADHADFKATPANIALWAKLAFEAGRDVAANSAKYQW